MGEADRYRSLNRLSLRQVFVSLGVPRDAFRVSNPSSDRPIFDAMIKADASRPNGLWLFKGSDYFLYDLASGDIVEGPLPIAGNWAATTLPEQFKSGIHAATWGGPAFPHFWTFFKDELYVALDSRQEFNVTEGPRGVLGAWASGAWTDPSGKFVTPGVPVALHGVGSNFDGMVHFFKNGQYIRHNLKTGQPVTQLAPITDEWRLPEPFSSRIDGAFYGSGPTEENIFFVTGEQYLLYDFRTQETLASGPLEERFPAFARFVGRPQLFLVEDYVVETLVGPSHLGRLIDTRSIGAGSKITRILVTETTDMSKQSISKSLLESQDSAVLNNFYDRLDKSTASSDETDRYRYQLNAHAHGEASATSAWGGEVDATLDVQGGSDSVRSALAESTFNSIGGQVNEAKRETQQRTYTDATEFESTARVLKKEIFEETNTSDSVRVYEFFEQLQPYITLLTLQNIRVGFSDGTAAPKVVELRDAEAHFTVKLVDPTHAKRLVDFVRGELAGIADHQGAVTSLLADSPAAMTVKPNLISSLEIPLSNGEIQTVAIRGFIKAERSWIEPTFTISCVQRDQ